MYEIRHRGVPLIQNADLDALMAEANESLPPDAADLQLWRSGLFCGEVVREGDTWRTHWTGD